MIFVTWLWRGRDTNRDLINYGVEHVRVLDMMLRRHGGHRLVCAHSREFDVEGPVMPDEVAALPGFLPKLWAWSPEFHELIGERFASIDLDVVLLGDVSPLLTGSFRTWDYARDEHFNTSLFVLAPGEHQAVWRTLSLDKVEALRRTAKRWTWDQSWACHVLGPDVATFGEADGVICYRPKRDRLVRPEGALAAFFCGPYDPRSEAKVSPWVREAWR